MLLRIPASRRLASSTRPGQCARYLPACIGNGARRPAGQNRLNREAKATPTHRQTRTTERPRQRPRNRNSTPRRKRPRPGATATPRQCAKSRAHAQRQRQGPARQGAHGPEVNPAPVRQQRRTRATPRPTRAASGQRQENGKTLQAAIAGSLTCRKARHYSGHTRQQRQRRGSAVAAEAAQPAYPPLQRGRVACAARRVPARAGVLTGVSPAGASRPAAARVACPVHQPAAHAWPLSSRAPLCVSGVGVWLASGIQA